MPIKEIFNWPNRGLREMYNRYVKQARNRNISFGLSKEQFIALVTSPECFYCTRPPYQESYGVKVLGVDRVENDKGYFENNCVPCCKECNVSKGKKTVEKFLTKESLVHG